MAYLAVNIAEVGETRNACVIFVGQPIEKCATLKSEKDMPGDHGD